MRIRRVALALCVSSLTLLPAPAEAQNTMNGEIGVMFWKPSPELTIQSGALTGVTGITNIDFVSEFGIEDKWFPGFRASLGRKHKVNFGYVPVKYEADTVITRTITFRGQTIRVGAPASTNIQWDLWRVGYEWDFVSTEKGYVGLLVDLKYNKVVASINSPVLTSAAETEQQAPVPTIGVGFKVYPVPMFAIGGEFAGFKYKRGEGADLFDAKFFDFDVNGTVLFGRHVGVTGGYKSVTVDYVIDDDSGDLKLKGPYVGGLLRF